MAEQHNHHHMSTVTVVINEEVLKAPPGALAAKVSEAHGNIPYMPPVQPPEVDPWGTKFEWAGMPEIYDSGDRVYMDVHHISGMSMLCMRMRWGPYADGQRRDNFGAPAIPFDHLAVHKSREKVIIFIVKNGEAITLEDQKELFPSDELVTKLRLLTQDEPASPGLSYSARL